jgi:hypothetical protein
MRPRRGKWSGRCWRMKTQLTSHGWGGEGGRPDSQKEAEHDETHQTIVSSTRRRIHRLHRCDVRHPPATAPPPQPPLRDRGTPPKQLPLPLSSPPHPQMRSPLSSILPSWLPPLRCPGCCRFCCHGLAGPSAAAIMPDTRCDLPSPLPLPLLLMRQCFFKQ